jgi:VIT1/CCC1 family predicted Fe2+/Mn2+ transporter
VVLRALAAVFALIAVACMALAIVGMVTGRPGDRAGFVIRALALACFATAVVLNVVSR